MSLYSDVSLRTPGSFRLLNLLPGKIGSMFKLELSYELLQNKPQYEALSYEWGSPEDGQIVLCNQQTLRVTSGLAAALEQLRFTDRSRRLWVDAICIDQDNINEKNKQVALMRDIYMQAEIVLIWLGKERQYTKDAFQMLPNLARFFITRNVNRASIGHMSPFYSTLDSIPERKELQLANRTLWESIFDLFSRTYFRRTWIVQEIVVASRAKVVCGSQELSWTYFHWAASYVNTTTYLLHQMPCMNTIVQVSSIAELKNRFKQDQVKGLMDTLSFIQESSATNPRDKVYALLGLHQSSKRNPPRQSNEIVVDYQKSPGRVFQEAAEYVISVEQDLRIFHGQPFAARVIDDMPSWVPDWSIRIKGAPTAFLVVYYKLRFCLTPKFRFAKGSLFLRGVILDEIDYVTDTMSCEDPLPHLKEIILRLSRNKLITRTQNELTEWRGYYLLLDAWKSLSSHTYTFGQTFQEALWRTLIGNIAKHELAQSQFQQHFCAVITIMLLRERGFIFDCISESAEIKVNEAMQKILRTDKIAQQLYVNAQRWKAQPYFEELVNTIHGRVFFITLQGRIGFAAPGAKTGDKVSILGGGWTPFILRSSPRGFYTMIGDSYVHGFMNGEIFKVFKGKVSEIELR